MFFIQNTLIIHNFIHNLIIEKCLNNYIILHSSYKNNVDSFE